MEVAFGSQQTTYRVMGLLVQKAVMATVLEVEAVVDVLLSTCKG